jgi:hypothetical protein
MFAVAVGEQFDAINFYGPFTTFDDAELWADTRIGYANTWIVDLRNPTSSSTL